MNKKVFFTASGHESVKAISCIMVFLFICSSSISAETQKLPAPEEVERIWIQPHDDKLKNFFTPESLLATLPHLQRTTIGKSMAFGKVWLWQKGIIYLKDGKELH